MHPEIVLPCLDEAEALLLKLLARRGMALCQLTRYDEAAADYTRAAELDPQNEQLKKDLQLIEAARGSGQGFRAARCVTGHRQFPRRHGHR